MTEVFTTKMLNILPLQLYSFSLLERTDWKMGIDIILGLKYYVIVLYIAFGIILVIGAWNKYIYLKL